MAEGGKTSTWPREAERVLLADACRHSAWLFNKYAMGLAVNPQGYWLVERIHKPVLDWIQDHFLTWLRTRKIGRAKRLRVMAVLFRTFGKTMLITKGFSLWMHLWDGDLALMIDSISKARSEEFLISIRNVMDGSDAFALFTYLYGNWKAPGRRWTATKGLDTAYRKTMSRSEPSFSTTSVETGITGLHPDVLVPDDLVSEEKLTDYGDAWLRSCDKHTGSVIPAVKSNGFILMVGTPYHDKDPVNKAMRIEGVCENAGMPIDDRRVVVKEKGSWHVYWLPVENEDGSSIAPEIWPDDELELIRRSRPRLYAAQYLLRPGLEEKSHFSEKDVERLWVPIEKVPKEVVAQIAIDTAFRKPGQKDRGDWNVVQKWLHARDGSGRVYFHGGTGSPNWNEGHVAEAIIRYVEELRTLGFHVSIITDEDFGSRMSGLWLRFLKNSFVVKNVQMPRIHLIPRGGSGEGMKKKLTRMRDALTYWASGYVRLIEGATMAHHLIDSVINFRGRAHDDWADTAADVFDQEIYRPARNPISPDDLGTFPLHPADRILKRPVDDRVVAAFRAREEAWERAHEGPLIVGADDEQAYVEVDFDSGW